MLKPELIPFAFMRTMAVYANKVSDIYKETLLSTDRQTLISKCPPLRQPFFTLLLSIIFLLLSDFSFAAIRYVKPVGTGALNGSSWDDASGDLQAMIDASAIGDEVWVAAGTYKPGAYPTGCSGCTTDRDYAFSLKDGVQIYGGFAGTETMRSQRNWISNLTILSGDFLGDDIVSGSGSTLSIMNNGENAYHVVIAAFTDNTPSTLLDGFNITGGNANALTNITISSQTIQASYGGGVYYDGGINSLINNNIRGNSSTGLGGGIYTSENINFLHNNTIALNKANSGGGFYSIFSTDTLTNNTISENSAINGGGGLFMNNGTKTITNNTISENSANDGGGLYMNDGISIMTNNTVSENLATINGGGLYMNNGTHTITNSNIWGNGSEIVNNVATITVTYSNVQGGYTGTGNKDSDPLFVNASDIDGPDNIHRTADDGLRLQPSSPAINMGNNAAIPMGITSDITGGTRILQGTVDMGAYEQVGCLPIIKTTINSAQITANNDNINDTIHINVCNGIINNLKIDSFIIESGGTANVKVRQIITGSGASVSPWIAAGTAAPQLFAGAMATATLSNPGAPGTVYIKFFAFNDVNTTNDLFDDPAECKGDTIVYLVTVTPAPTVSFMIGGNSVASINNGIADPSEATTVNVCNGGMYNVANLVHSNPANRYIVAVTPSGGGLLFDGAPAANGDISSAQFDAAVGPHTITLVNPAIGGSLVQVITPYNDVAAPFGSFNTGDCIGDPITITYNSGPVKPIITTQPVTDYACGTQPAQLNVQATGIGLVHYQWQEETTPGNFVNIPGANNATLIINNVMVSGKTYRVRVYSNYGASCVDSLDSDPAQVLIGSDIGLACNKLINISLADDCSLEIEPDMILEGSYNHPDFSVQVINALGQPIGNVINSSFLNKKWKVQVFDNCSGNSCWGEIFVEDKLAPVILCRPDTLVNCFDTTDFKKAPYLPLATDNCLLNLKVEVIEDYTIPYGACINDTVALRVIKYRAKDGSNNVSNICERKIYYRKINIFDILIPLNYDGHTGNNPALSCSYDWETGIKNRYPDPHETGRPYYTGGNPFTASIMDNGLCKINIRHFDEIKPGSCAGTIIIFRKWEIMDWCTGMIRNEIQVIKVIDDLGPSFDIPAILPVTTAKLECSGEFTAPDPINVSDCSGNNKYTYTVQFKLDPSCSSTALPDPYAFISGNTKSEQILTGPDKGKWKITGLPSGCSWLKYTLTDSCGNSSSKYTKITVSDGTAPVAVCDENTIVTLSADGKASVYAISFDDGSYDNCSSVTLEVRRMTIGCDSSTVWANYINLCCDDPGRVVQVELKVTDQSGNTNVCMVNVETQDKIQPVLVCPGNVTINCGADTSAAAIGKPIQGSINTGSGYYNDNCSNVALTWTNTGSLNKCGEGIITRTYRVSDQAGNAKTCEHKITVLNTTPYTGPSWTTVANIEIEGCGNKDIDPAITGKPIYGNGACSQVSSNYKDETYSNVDGVCYKILRKWTVIDWCKFRSVNDPVTHRWPSVSTEGINQWTHTQVIKIVDRTKPVISMTNAGKTYQVAGSSCGGLIDLVEAATDCSPEATAALTWSYALKRNNVTYRTGTGKGSTLNASGNYEAGDYEITWTAQDLCGNSETKIYNFTVRDNKKPQVYCQSSLTTVVMPSTGSVSITARPFNNGSSDNCGGPLAFSFVERYPLTAGDSIMTFTCSNFPSDKDTIHRSLRMYVWDQARNYEFCTVKIVIQKNAACNPAPSLERTLGGNISNEKNLELKDVEVYLSSENTEMNKLKMTDSKGMYKFGQLSTNVDFTIKPIKNDDHLNGISTLDLVMIQQHILGLKTFKSPYQYHAADANGDKKVTAADLTEIRKLILGINAEFNKVNSWKFFNRAQQIAEIHQPWSISESIHEATKSTDVMDHNFIAVKTGDVNISAKTSADMHVAESRTRSGSFVIDNKSFAPYQKIVVPITSQNISALSGFQTSFTYDDTKLSFKGIIPGALAIEENAYVNKDGNLIVSWFSADGEVDVNNKTLFVLEFESMEKGTLDAALFMNSDKLKSEYYGVSNTEHPLNLTINKLYDAPLLEVGQNTPNPFSATTHISVLMPQEGSAQLKVMDNSGKIVIQKEELFRKGKNEFTIQHHELGSPGIYYYEVKSLGQSFMKKLIKIVD